MWIGKLFGGRKRPPEIDPDEEPSRFSPPGMHEATGVHQDLKRRTQGPQKASGFDPYNSGTFKKKKDNAWERVGRR